MERYVATIRTLDAENAARNEGFLRAIQGIQGIQGIQAIQTAHVLPTHQPGARPS